MGTTEGPRADFSIEGVTNLLLQPTNKQMILSPTPSVTLAKLIDFITKL